MGRQPRFIGHVMRRRGSENIVTTGKIGVRKGRYGPRKVIVGGLAKWLGRSTRREMRENVKR